MEYSVWPILETRACAKPHKSIDALKSSLKREWWKMPQEQLRKSVHGFSDKVRSVVSKERKLPYYRKLTLHEIKVIEINAP